uniref:Uncharacterized protein n=1 Tax=Romanomermis culicivorax TaxID=13658 RepID=A0A915J003_ROMCU
MFLGQSGHRSDIRWTKTFSQHSRIFSDQWSPM